MKKIFCSTIILATILFYGCHKNSSSPASTSSTNPSPQQILTTEANTVIEANYATFAIDAQNLYSGTVALQATTNATNLANCKALWLAATKDYELAEVISTWGPASQSGSDGTINSFPIDTVALDDTVNGTSGFTVTYINNLQGDIKGFHGFEYELYGANGTKAAAQFTPRQLGYMVALSLNIVSIAQQLDSAWNSSISGNYNVQFVNAGNGSTIYTSQKAAFGDLLYGLANYCEIVEITKLNTPFKNPNPMAYEESPYASNSLQDMYNNVIGIQNLYLGQYGSQSGPGISNFVSQYDISLDNKMRNYITQALNSISVITPPFSTAITSNPAQVQNAVNLTDSLDKALKNQLYPFVLNHL